MNSEWRALAGVVDSELEREVASDKPTSELQPNCRKLS